MEVKLIEIRDRATFIPAMAVRLYVNDPYGEDSQEYWLLKRAGYDNTQLYVTSDEFYVVLWRLGGGPAEYDAYAWGNRTMATAHAFIIEHWRTIQSGQVIDVEFILGETKMAKTSERHGETNVVRTLGEEGRIIP